MSQDPRPVARPRNETEADIAHEEAARAKIETAWRCTIQPLSERLYGCDWGIFKDAQTFVGFAEYKYRGTNLKGEEVKWGTYPSVILSLGKWMNMKQFAQLCNRHFYLFFEWSDCLVYGRWPPFTGMGYPIQYGIELGGRDDRGQDGDREPVIIIPNKEFKIFGVGQQSKKG